MDIRPQKNRLMAFTESTNILKPPHNTKRRAKSPIRGNSTTKAHGKLSIQDFVRRDPGYTPNIEHLVFPHRNSDANKESIENNESTTAGNNKTTTTTTTTSANSGSGGSGGGVTVTTKRTRLAEMFALSRHLQQRSADRELKHQQKQQQKMKSLNVSLISFSFCLIHSFLTFSFFNSKA